MLGRILGSLFSPAEAAPSAAALNPLEEYFYNNEDRLIHKWRHYFEIYHRHFAPFRDKSPVVVEIGVSHGGSLQMWRDYFGAGCRIVGIDNNPQCAQFAGGDITILIGDQGDRDFLASVRDRVPHIDILIDDGGHTMNQQIATFEELYPHIQPRGIYLCEDVHTSLLAEFGGGVRRAGTFLEYTKDLIDRLHGWHSMEPELLGITEFTRSTFALHFYDCIVAIERRPLESPTHTRVGTRSF